jgi:hypothetical protein
MRTLGRALFLVGLIAGPATAMAVGTPFDALIGAWSGGGQVRYQDGQSEPVRCTAYYTGDKQRLRLAIRCKSSGTEVEVRGQLTARGQTLVGTWEERTFNASGEASGRIVDNRISLSIGGGGFSGTMSVSVAGGRQVVAISTEGVPMRNVSVTLTKGG